MMGLQAPAGTPARVVSRLQIEAAKAMREPAMAARMTQLGMVLEENGTSHYKDFMLDDMEKYAQAVKKLNLQTR
jgi:tripartite-type tricarboxylate transporter receptor subunit TctC